jgi:peroxiredoxin
MSRGRIFVVFGLGLWLVLSACQAADMPAAKIKVGEKMEDFTLPDVNGKPHRLYDFSGKKAVAVIFIATRCPYSNAFTHVMADLEREYESRGVAFIGINANSTDSVAELAEHAHAHGLDFLVLKDEGNKVADRLGATVTPEVFLLDSTWTLRYHGALGNSHQPTNNPAKTSSDEVRPALDGILNGNSVVVTETKAFGCSIKRVKVS